MGKLSISIGDQSFEVDGELTYGGPEVPALSNMPLTGTFKGKVQLDTSVESIFERISKIKTDAFIDNIKGLAREKEFDLDAGDIAFMHPDSIKNLAERSIVLNKDHPIKPHHLVMKGSVVFMKAEYLGFVAPASK